MQYGKTLPKNAGFQSEAEAGLRCSCVMSVSSESDPEGGEGSAWVAGVAA